MTDANERPAPVEAMDLVVLFRRASRIMDRESHRRDHAHHAQDHVLSVIREHNSINQGELLEILDVRSSSLSEMLRKLEGKGLVVRQRDERDRRSFVVSATEQPRFQHRGHGKSRESADSLFACLDAGERSQFRDMLLKIIASLEEAPQSRESDCSTRPRRGAGKRYGKGGRGRGFPG